jgi:DNA (cytosine-5)-methyltransferase 1
LYNILSLFSGAGALDYGFELTGRFETSVCIEYQPEFCETLMGNQPRGFLSGAQILNHDLSRIAPSSVIGVDSMSPQIDGIIGGPPCESFSARGKKLGLADPRGNLVFKFFDWVTKLRPSFFLFENVSRLAKIHEGEIARELCKIGEETGYSTFSTILNAADYGCATSRKRFFIVGIKGSGPYFFPNPTHSPDGYLDKNPCWVAVADALEGLPPPSKSAPGHPQGHIGIAHKPEIVARFAKLRPGQEDPIRKRTKIRLDAPSPTLMAGNLKGIRSHIHPTEPRELTNRESARIHGFPDHFEFFGNHASMGKQIANSVPIPLAQALGQSISEHMDNNP